MIFFSREDCDYCKMLEADHLGVMAHSVSYKDKVIIRKVMLDDYDSIRDFSGKKIDVDELSRRFSISVTPTLVFLDQNGNLLGKKMPGYNRSDFYGYYLDEAINNAKMVLQQQAAL